MANLDPASTYKAIIDELATKTRPCSVNSQRVADNQPFPAESGQSSFNILLSSLTSEQRALLSELLLEERNGGIHDTLAVLSWWIDCREVSLAVSGDPMPVDLSGMGLHGDYVGRSSDWDWPNAEA